MTASSSNGWYNINEQRRYPLTDQATCVGSNEQRVAEGFLADLSIRYTQLLGPLPAGFSLVNAVPFLSAASASPKLMSATIALYHNGITLPIAVASIRKDSGETYRPIKIIPVLDGVAGWIVFGKQPQYDFFTALTSPDAGGLVASTVRMHRDETWFNDMGVGEISRMSGFVPLYGSGSLGVLAATEPGEETNSTTMTPEEDPCIYTERPRMRRVLDGTSRDCVVIRLTEEACRSFAPFSPQPGDPGRSDQLLTLNSVLPDDDGIITLEFTGAGESGQSGGNVEPIDITALLVGGIIITSDEGQNGVSISASVGVSDTCPLAETYQLNAVDRTCRTYEDSQLEGGGG